MFDTEGYLLSHVVVSPEKRSAPIPVMKSTGAGPLRRGGWWQGRGSTILIQTFGKEDHLGRESTDSGAIVSPRMWISDVGGMGVQCSSVRYNPYYRTANECLQEGGQPGLLRNATGNVHTPKRSNRAQTNRGGVQLTSTVGL